jgi:hypothetical protein
MVTAGSPRCCHSHPAFIFLPFVPTIYLSSHDLFVFPSFVRLSAMHSFGGDGGRGVPLSLSLTFRLDGEEGGVVSVAVVKLKTA